MGFFGTVGRLLLASLFLLSGYDKLTTPQNSTGSLATNYEAVHKYFVKQTQLVLPEQLSPAFIKLHTTEIVQAVAGVEILGALLVIFNFFVGGLLLSTFLVGTIVLVHNPLVFNKQPEEQLFQTTQALKNLALIGGLLLVGNTKTAVQEPESTKKKNQQPKQTAQEPKTKAKKQ